MSYKAKSAVIRVVNDQESSGGEKAGGMIGLHIFSPEKIYREAAKSRRFKSFDWRLSIMRYMRTIIGRLPLLRNVPSLGKMA